MKMIKVKFINNYKNFMKMKNVLHVSKNLQLKIQESQQNAFTIFTSHVYMSGSKEAHFVLFVIG
ncbi:hypothetical protein CsatA_017381 [Cannabis sativa]